MNLDRTLRSRLTAAGQEFLWDWLEQLEPAKREKLLRQLDTIDLDLVTRLGRGEGLAQPPSGNLEPLPYIPDSDRGSATPAAHRGAQALREGRVAFAMLAGGQASRLRYDGPKGAYPIGPVSERSLFRILTEQVLRARRDFGVLPLLAVTTSSTTDAATRHFYESHDCFGMDRDSLVFSSQASLPALDDEGRLILGSPDRIFTSPDGHGGAVVALDRDGVLAAWEERGIEVVCTFQVDNPVLRVVDPDFLGRLLDGAAPIATKIVLKTDPAEKVGVIVRQGGRPAIVEYSELSKEQQRQRDDDGQLTYRLGSIAVHAFDLKFLRGVLGSEMPLHTARKDIRCVDENGQAIRRPGTKFERFLFDLLPQADDITVVEVDRGLEFAPLKNAVGADSPESVRQALLAQYRRWYEEAGRTAPADDLIELSPLDAMGPADLC